MAFFLSTRLLIAYQRSNNLRLSFTQLIPQDDQDDQDDQDASKSDLRPRPPSRSIFLLGPDLSQKGKITTRLVLLPPKRPVLPRSRSRAGRVPERLYGISVLTHSLARAANRPQRGFSYGKQTGIHIFLSPATEVRTRTLPFSFCASPPSRPLRFYAIPFGYRGATRLVRISRGESHLSLSLSLSHFKSYRLLLHSTCHLVRTRSRTRLVSYIDSQGLTRFYFLSFISSSYFDLGLLLHSLSPLHYPSPLSTLVLYQPTTYLHASDALLCSSHPGPPTSDATIILPDEQHQRLRHLLLLCLDLLYTTTI